jgi:hypothetical protein
METDAMQAIRSAEIYKQVAISTTMQFSLLKKKKKDNVCSQ